MSGTGESCGGGRRSTSGHVEKQQQALPLGLPQYVEDMMSSEQLIEEFGLQSLLERPQGGIETEHAGG